VSQDNVEIVKDVFRFAQVDWERISARLDPDVRLDQTRFPDGGVYHGRPAFRSFYRRWFGTWDELQITADQFLEEGNRVVVLLTLEGRGNGSGTPVTLRGADVWTLQDGKVVELVGYPNRDEALVG
jgi:ketosteroid isomerase-like protein